MVTLPEDDVIIINPVISGFPVIQSTLMIGRTMDSSIREFIAMNTTAASALRDLLYEGRMCNKSRSARDLRYINWFTV